MKEIENSISVSQVIAMSNLSLEDLVIFIRKNCYVLLGGALSGLVLGLVITCMLPTKWEASVQVRIGKLHDVFIEPPSQLIARLDNGPFKYNVLKSLNIRGADRTELLYDSLKIQIEKNDLISISLQAFSFNEASRYLSAVIDKIKKDHRTMADPMINRLSRELASIELQLNRVQSEEDKLPSLLQKGIDHVDNKNLSQYMLALGILAIRNEQIRILNDKKQELEEQLSPERTFSTELLRPIDVKEILLVKRVIPIIGIFAGLGLAIGFSTRRCSIPNIKNYANSTLFN